MMDKEIHFYESDRSDAAHSWRDTCDLIVDEAPLIHTTQMGLLGVDLLNRRYRVFIRKTSGDWYEIKLGSNNERTNIEIKMSDNLYSLWVGGEFDEVVKC